MWVESVLGCRLCSKGSPVFPDPQLTLTLHIPIQSHARKLKNELSCYMGKQSQLTFLSFTKNIPVYFFFRERRNHLLLPETRIRSRVCFALTASQVTKLDLYCGSDGDQRVWILNCFSIFRRRSCRLTREQQNTQLIKYRCIVYFRK